MQVTMEYSCELCGESFTTQRGLQTHCSKSKMHARKVRDADQIALKRQRQGAASDQPLAQPPTAQPQQQEVSSADRQEPLAVQPLDTDAQVGAFLTLLHENYHSRARCRKSDILLWHIGHVICRLAEILSLHVPRDA